MARDESVATSIDGCGRVCRKAETHGPARLPIGWQLNNSPQLRSIDRVSRLSEADETVQNAMERFIESIL